MAALFLQVNGYRLIATNEELETFTLHVTTQKPAISEMATWFRRHSSKIRTSGN